MAYLFYLITSIILIIVQTSVFPLIAPQIIFYDLMLLFVIYLATYKGLKEGFPTILIISIVMDSLSGAPVGLYLTCYIWIFFGVRWLSGFLDSGSFILLPVAVAGGVFLENLFFVLPFFAEETKFYVTAVAIYRVVVNVLCAVITGPFIILVLHTVQERWEKIFRYFFENKSV
jgi:hypothetical protein